MSHLMNPHISIPRQHGGPPNFGGTTNPSGRSDGLRMPRFFKRWASAVSKRPMQRMKMLEAQSWQKTCTTPLDSSNSPKWTSKWPSGKWPPSSSPPKRSSAQSTTTNKQKTPTTAPTPPSPTCSPSSCSSPASPGVLPPRPLSPPRCGWRCCSCLCISCSCRCWWPRRRFSWWAGCWGRGSRGCRGGGGRRGCFGGPRMGRGMCWSLGIVSMWVWLWHFPRRGVCVALTGAWN